MFKIVSETPVMACSLIVTGVSMPAERDYIGSGGYGRIYKGDLHGAVVALKVLYKSDNNAVGPLYIVLMASLVTSISAGVLSRGADVGVPEAQVRATIFRNLRIRWRKRIPILPRLSLHDERYSGPMEKESKSINIRDGKPCMAFLSFALHRCSLPFGRFWKLLRESNTFIQKAWSTATSAGYRTGI